MTWHPIRGMRRARPGLRRRTLHRSQGREPNHPKSDLSVDQGTDGIERKGMALRRVGGKRGDGVRSFLRQVVRGVAGESNGGYRCRSRKLPEPGTCRLRRAHKDRCETDEHREDEGFIPVSNGGNDRLPGRFGKGDVAPSPSIAHRTDHARRQKRGCRFCSAAIGGLAIRLSRRPLACGAPRT